MIVRTNSNLTLIGIVVVVGTVTAAIHWAKNQNKQELQRLSYKDDIDDDDKRGAEQDEEEENMVLLNNNSKATTGDVIDDEDQQQPLEDPLSYLQQHEKWKLFDVDLEQFIRQLPKVELHVHLDGSFDTDILWNHYLQNKKDMLTWCLPVHTILPWDQSVFPVRQLVLQCHTADEFRQLCTCRGQRSLYEMLKCFEIFLPIVRVDDDPQTLPFLEELAYDFCRRQAQQHVVYTEVRYSPHLLAEGAQLNLQHREQHNNSTNDDNDEFNNNNNNNNNNSNEDKDLLDRAERVLQVITKGLRRGCLDYGISINQILCAITWRPDWAMHVVELADKYRPPPHHHHLDTRDTGPCCGYVVGVDIAAGEEHFDATLHPDLHQPHYDMMQRAKALHIPITLHAGEVGDQADSNVIKAVQKYGAIRIGHGYRITSETRRMLQERNIHVEVCPTSSAETGGWDYDATTTPDPNNNTGDKQQPSQRHHPQEPRKWHEHPLVDMIRDGLSVSINSDDPAVFDTSLCWQYRILLGKAGSVVTKQDVIAMTRNAIDAAFCDSEETKRLHHVLQDFLDQYEGNNSSQQEQQQQPILRKASFHDRVRSHHSF